MLQLEDLGQSPFLLSVTLGKSFQILNFLIFKMGIITTKLYDIEGYVVSQDL